MSCEIGILRGTPFSACNVYFITATLYPSTIHRKKGYAVQKGFAILFHLF
jgi:hypothetical protein